MKAILNYAMQFSALAEYLMSLILNVVLCCTVHAVTDESFNHLCFTCT